MMKLGSPIRPNISILNLDDDNDDQAEFIDFDSMKIMLEHGVVDIANTSVDVSKVMVARNEDKMPTRI